MQTTTTRDAANFRRFFSFSAVEHAPSSPFALQTGLEVDSPIDTTAVLGEKMHMSPSLSPSMDPGPSSPAAMFLSAFLPSPSLSPSNSKEGETSQEPAEEEGTTISGFTLGPTFAHGGFSVIRKGTSASGGIVAIKCVPTSFPSSPSHSSRAEEKRRREEIEHEESIWSTLSHEHILPLFASFHSRTTAFFVMPLCPAGSLLDVLRAASGGTSGNNAGLHPDETGRIFRQIVRGLRYLHTERRLVHRDIKLENVLVDEAGVCRIADFGIARYVDEEDSDPSNSAEEAGLPLTLDTTLNTNGGLHRAVSLAVPRPAHVPRRDRLYSTNTHAHTTAGGTTTTSEEFQPGSLPYAAPELLGAPSSSIPASVSATSTASKSAFLSHPHSDPGAAPKAHVGIAHKRPAPAQDIWALGVLLYALLTGRLPFVDSFEPRLVVKILGGTYLPPTHTTRRTLAVLSGCLTARVSERWSIERVDGAAWVIGSSSRAGSDFEGEEESVDVSPCTEEELELGTESHAAKHAALLAENTRVIERDRGRRRAERSESRAPYMTRTNSQSVVRSKSRAAREELELDVTQESYSRPQSHSVVRSKSRVARTDVEEEIGTIVEIPHTDRMLDRGRRRAERSSSRAPYSRSNSKSVVRSTSSASASVSREYSGSRSRSRSRSRGPLTPPPLHLGLSVDMGLNGLGIGFPPGKRPAATHSHKTPRTTNEEESEPISMLLATHVDIEEGQARSQRAESTPPGAWRGTVGSGARSRSLGLDMS